MSRTKILIKIIFTALLTAIFLWTKPVQACTSAVIGPSASAKGIPMLWKNRDTDVLSNKIIYVRERPFNYIGIVNARETSGRFVYAGLNSAGFGIMNTVAYNLPKITDEMHDLEGQIMAAALRTCRSVDDFEVYIKKNLGASLGSWANFGVIDADGHAVIFEVHNNGYKKLDSLDVPGQYVINTNFSRSGKAGLGAGYLRFDQASALFKKIPVHGISHETIFQKISRDFGHPLVNHPTLDDLKKQSLKMPVWIHNRNCINRPSTSAAVVINGKIPGKEHSIATLWALLGEPVTSIAVPVWVEAKKVPLPLYKGAAAPICAEAMRIKKIIHPFSEGSKNNYMNVSKLVNKEGKGFLPGLKKTEQEIFKATTAFLKSQRTASEMASFQDKMAQKALTALMKISER